jgi:DNA-binding CsgD family transcriptional regulator/PAS domain-containing protein
VATDGERESLIDLIYDAAAEPPLWGDVLLRISDLMDSTGALIDGFSYHRGFFAFHNFARLDPAISRLQQAHYIKNPWSDVMVRRPAGDLVRSDDIVPLDDLKRTGFYADIQRPHDLAHSIMQPLAAQPDFTVAFCLMRSERKGPFSAEELATARSFLPHIRRAMQLRLRLDGYEAMSSAHFDVIDTLGHGVIIVDAAGKPLLVNKSAEEMMIPPNVFLRLGGSNEISAGSPTENARLRALIANVIRGDAGGAIRLSTADGRWVVVFAAPLRGRLRIMLRQEGIADYPAAMLFIANPSSEFLLPQTLLGDCYGLTPTETEVAVSLSRASLLKAATTLGISMNTLKTHARRVYAKTGVRGQVELTRLLAKLALPIRL